MGASVTSILLALVVAGQLRGQSPSPSASPTAKPKFGSLRLWNMQPIGSPNLELVLAGTDPQGSALLTASPLNFYAAYLHLPLGTYQLKLCRTGNRDNPVKSFNVTLRSNMFITILATQPSADQIAAELMDDTPDPGKPQTNRLTVRQFCPGVRVQVTTPDRQSTDLLDVGRTQTLEGLPNGMVALRMRATLANGTVRTWNAEADFRTSRHASLLILTDPYGRIRPRVSVDGPSPEAEDAAAAEAAASSPNRVPSP